MTRSEFDRLPLLLKTSIVLEVLQINEHSLNSLVESGKIRTRILQEGGYRKFLKSDVAALVGFDN